MDYFEKDLEIPFMRVLSENINGLPMSSIKKILLEKLNPTGTSADPSTTRPGEIKLHQRIGNFTPERKRRIFVKGYVTYDRDTEIYKITEAGILFLADKEETYESLISQGFTKKQREKEIDNDYKDLIIEEGTIKEISSKQRKRSQLLRNLKIYKIKAQNRGKLPCYACGFDFEEKYGRAGKDFIQIHHTEPIHETDIRGRSTHLREALKKVIPLCSNCHSVVHRNKNKMLSVEELKEIIRANE